MTMWPGRLMTRLLTGAGARAELYSLLSVDECLRRLNVATDPPGKLFGSKPVVGQLRAGSFRGHQRIGYRNSFQTHAVVLLTAEETGTRIRCRFGMHPVVIAFMAIWFTGVALIGGPITIAILAGISIWPIRTSHSLPPQGAALVAPAMLA